MSFPPKTHGFLYYTAPSHMDSSPPQHTDDLSHELGQIRFRITASDDPVTFASGKDLLMPNGLPWYTIPRAPYVGANDPPSLLWKLLLHDGLVSDSIIYTHKQRRFSDELTRFGQHFYVNFVIQKLTLTVRSEDMGQESTGKNEKVQVNVRNPLRPLAARNVEGPALYSGTSLFATIEDTFSSLPCI